MTSLRVLNNNINFKLVVICGVELLLYKDTTAASVHGLEWIIFVFRTSQLFDLLSINYVFVHCISRNCRLTTTIDTQLLHNWYRRSQSVHIITSNVLHCIDCVIFIDQLSLFRQFGWWSVNPTINTSNL